MPTRGPMPAASKLGALGMAAFGGAALTAVGAAATGYPLATGAFVLLAAAGGAAVHLAQREQVSSGAPRLQSPRTFDDVAGMDEVRHELKEVVDYIRNRERYIELDAQLPRGILLYGPPGTGKTLLAKALAAEAGASFHYASGSSFVEKYVGVGSQRVRQLFAKARRSAPAIIFLDEIDAVGRARGTGGENVEYESTLNQLLTEIDGFSSTDNVLLIAATNRRELLDSALLRPGRLDRQVYIGLPDVTAREAILKVHTRKKPLAAGVDLAAMARQTPGLSGAHLAALLNEAALTAARARRTELTQADLADGLERVVAGLTGRSQVISAEERRIVAYHEAGHAVVGHALHMGTIERISLLSRSQALGYVLQVPEERLLHTRRWLQDRIATLLAGRAAEDLVFGDISTGAADDLQKATSIAEHMVLHYGMGQRHRNHVVREQAMIFSPTVQNEVEAILDEAWRKATEIAKERRHLLERLAGALLEREALDADEIAAILAGV